MPKNYDGLLHPALKGRMGLTIDDTSTKSIAAMLKIKGPELVKKLKGQEISLHTIIPPALARSDRFRRTNRRRGDLS